MKLAILSIFAAVSLMACDNPRPEVLASSSNPNFPVAKLFTFEGCTTYRFQDSAYHYYTRCTGSATVENAEMVGCGKNCTREEKSTTIECPNIK